jgi:hypothetical protein
MFDQVQEALSPGQTHAINANLTASAKTSLRAAAGGHGRVLNVALHAGRQIFIAVGALIWAVWAYGVAVNELDSLTNADFRDMFIYRADTCLSPWVEARRRAADTPQSLLVVIGAVGLILAAMLAAAVISVAARCL